MEVYWLRSYLGVQTVSFTIGIRPSWHVAFSLELNKLIKKLDAAADEAAKSSPIFTPDRKERVESDIASLLPPPVDAPNWTLEASMRKGQ